MRRILGAADEFLNWAVAPSHVQLSGRPLAADGIGLPDDLQIPPVGGADALLPCGGFTPPAKAGAWGSGARSPTDSGSQRVESKLAGSPAVLFGCSYERRDPMANALWRPRDGEAPLYEWWAPLHRFASRARASGVVWDVYTEQFAFEGRVLRRPRPTVHLYRHREAFGLLALDDHGTPFKVSKGGAYLRTGDLNAACWQAGLPHLQLRRGRPVLAANHRVDGVRVPSPAVASGLGHRLEIVREPSSGWG